MDYNEDRQVTFNHNFSRGKDLSLTGNVVESDKDQHAVIYLNTVGESTNCKNYLIDFCIYIV